VRLRLNATLECVEHPISIFAKQDDIDRMGLDCLHRIVHHAAFIVIASSALGGVLACVSGATTWGVLGLIVGLAGSSALFFNGLVELQRREQQLVRIITAPALTPRAQAASTREWWDEIS
jgi:hypothetical protein